MSKELKVSHKLEIYTKGLLLKKGIELKDDEYRSLMRRIGDISAVILFNSRKQLGFLELFYHTFVIECRSFLKKRGWPKKEIDEFCKDIELKYRQLQTEITPYIA